MQQLPANLPASTEKPSSERGTIAIAFVHEALACLPAHGLAPHELLHRAGIAPELLSAPQARVSSPQYGQLWHHIAQAIDDEFFGMGSHPMRSGSFTLLCHALIHADTLERALRRALRFLRLVIFDLEGELLLEGEHARIVVHDRTLEPKRAFAYGTYLLMLHGLACWLIGRRIPLLRAEFRCAEPYFSDEWQVFFSENLLFNQAQSGMVFERAFLALPNIQNERTMKEFLRYAPANFLVKYKNSEGLAARIRRRLREIPPEAWPDCDTLARQFHTSTATLRRRLEKEGITYRGILDGLRRDLAICHLSDGQLSMAEIAAQLGFTETSAFYRAFKKWTGLAPGQYRRHLPPISGAAPDTPPAAPHTSV